MYYETDHCMSTLLVAPVIHFRKISKHIALNPIFLLPQTYLLHRHYEVFNDLQNISFSLRYFS